MDFWQDVVRLALNASFCVTLIQHALTGHLLRARPWSRDQSCFFWFLGFFLSSYFSSSDSTEQKIHFPLNNDLWCCVF